MEGLNEKRKKSNKHLMVWQTDIFAQKTLRTIAEVTGQNLPVVMLAKITRLMLVEQSGQHLLVHVLTIFKATQLKSGCFVCFFVLFFRL